MSKRRKRRNRRFVQLQLDRETGSNQAVGEPVTQLEPDTPATINVVAYGPEKLHEQRINQPEEIRELIGKWPVLWVNVIGVRDAATIQKIGDIFLLHELALEDVIHIHQRSKVEPYGDQLFVILRSVALDHGLITSEQISIFMGNGFIVTFEEKPGIGGLGAVRDRIVKSSGHIRGEQADYLLYAIIDCIVDDFFPVVEAIGDALENVEDEILERTTHDTPAKIHELKRDVLGVRRAVWPARDTINILVRDDTSALLGPRTRIYLRDCYDHAMRIIDLVETQREMCSDLMDLYLSSVSNKMNEIMKVLTVVTLLFMPPTLVAGVFGMNFDFDGFHSANGFLYSLLLMFVSAAAVWLWARRKGWIGDSSAKR